MPPLILRTPENLINRTREEIDDCVQPELGGVGNINPIVAVVGLEVRRGGCALHVERVTARAQINVQRRHVVVVDPIFAVRQRDTRARGRTIHREACRPYFDRVQPVETVLALEAE